MAGQPHASPVGGAETGEADDDCVGHGTVADGESALLTRGLVERAGHEVGGTDQDPSALDDVVLRSAFQRAHEIVRARAIADAAEAAGLSEPDPTILVNLSEAGGSLRPE